MKAILRFRYSGFERAEESATQPFDTGHADPLHSVVWPEGNRPSAEPLDLLWATEFIVFHMLALQRRVFGKVANEVQQLTAISSGKSGNAFDCFGGYEGLPPCAHWPLASSSACIRSSCASETPFPRWMSLRRRASSFAFSGSLARIVCRRYKA